MLTAWFFARASRGRMAVGRVTAGILPLAKRGEERGGETRVFLRVGLDRQVNALLTSVDTHQSPQAVSRNRHRFLVFLQKDQTSSAC